MCHDCVHRQCSSVDSWNPVRNLDTVTTGAHPHHYRPNGRERHLSFSDNKTLTTKRSICLPDPETPKAPRREGLEAKCVEAGEGCAVREESDRRFSLTLAHFKEVFETSTTSKNVAINFDDTKEKALNEEELNYAARHSLPTCARHSRTSKASSNSHVPSSVQASKPAQTPPPTHTRRCRTGSPTYDVNPLRSLSPEKRAPTPTYPFVTSDGSTMASAGDSDSLANMDHLLADMREDYPHIFSRKPEAVSALRNWDIVALLGSGTFASVYRVRDPETGHQYAAKVLCPQRFSRSSGMRISEMFANEIRYHLVSHCPGVVRIHKIIRGSEGYVVFQDLIEGGTLWENSKCRNEQQCFLIFIQLLQTLLYLQQCRVVHRDLKPTNILRTLDGNSVQLTDFGWSEQFDHLGDHINELPGTVEINPPEVLGHFKQQTEKIDNYALGLNLLLLISQRFVCRNKKLRRISDAAKKVSERIAMIRGGGMLPGFTKSSWAVFLGLTESCAAERASLTQVLGSEWVCLSFAKFAAFLTPDLDLKHASTDFDDGRSQSGPLLWLPIVRRVAISSYSSMARRLLMDAVRSSVLSNSIGDGCTCPRKDNEAHHEPTEIKMKRADFEWGRSPTRAKTAVDPHSSAVFRCLTRAAAERKALSRLAPRDAADTPEEPWKARGTHAPAFSDTSTTGGCITDFEGSSVCALERTSSGSRSPAA